MICGTCGGPCESKPFFYQPDKGVPGAWYDAPLYFSKPNQSKADYAGPAGRVDFCTPVCATAFMAPSMRIAA